MAEGADQPWTRDTPWRQGHVFSPDAAIHLELASAETTPQVRVVVISHDCDLANDNLNAEPEVEVLVGGVAAALNGNFAWGKSPRTLHLQVQKGQGTEVLELVQTAKRRVPAYSTDRGHPFHAMAGSVPS